MGALNYWTFSLGCFFVLMNVANLYLGCSKSMEGWGWGKYSCGDLESGMFFNFNAGNLENSLILVMSATVFDRQADFIKICVPSLVMMLVLLAYWGSVTINGHSMPNVIYYMDAFVFGTFSIAVCMHKDTDKNINRDSNNVVNTATMKYGALNYWTFILGIAMTLMSAASQYTGCSKSMQAWGWGKYTCNGLESALSFNYNMINIQIQLVLMICATITVRKMDLVKLIAPVFIMMPVFIAYWSRKTINGHTMPNSIYIINMTILCSFVMAAIVHPGSTASAIQTDSTGRAPLLSS